jgi:hypothetical protein
MTTKETDRQRASAAGRALAKLGAQKGGRARAKKLSQEERSDIAHRGGKARWGLAPDDPPKPKAPKVLRPKGPPKAPKVLKPKKPLAAANLRLRLRGWPARRRKTAAA